MSGANRMMGAIEEENRLNPTILSYQQRDFEHPLNQKYQKPDGFENGIVRNRSCTDKLCCVLLVILAVFTTVLAGYTFMDGDLKYLVHESDFRAAPCGEDDMSGRKYVYWPIPTQDTDVRMCLADCPTTYNAYVCYYTPDGKETFDNGQIDPDLEDRDHPYCHPTMETEKLAYFCIPKEPYSNKQVRKAIEKDSALLRLAGRDVYISRWIMLGAIGGAIAIAILISLLYLCSYKTVVAAVIFSCLGTLAALILLAITFYEEYERNVDLFCFDGIDKWGCAGKYAKIYRNLCYATIVITVLYVLTLLMMRKKFKKLISAFVVSAKTLNKISNLWVYPFGSLLVMLLITYAIMYASFYALTIGERKIKTANGIPEGKVAYRDYDDIKHSTYYFIVVYFWFMLLLQASHYYVLSSASVMWYFNPRKNEEKTAAMKISVWHLLRYNFGSIVHAVTALPLTFPFKMIFGALKRRMEKAYYRSKVSAFLINSMSTCFQAYEVYLKYISMNGIVQVASSGFPYQKSSQLSYYILRRNYSKIKSLTFFMYYITTLTRLTAALFAFLITYHVTSAEQDTDKNHSGVFNPIFPALVAFFISVLATAPFVDIFDAVFDSIAQSLIMDEEINDYERVAQATIDYFDDIIALDFEDDEVQGFGTAGKGPIFDHVTPNATNGSKKSAPQDKKDRMAMKRVKKTTEAGALELVETEEKLEEPQLP